jgi:post-segregation antitoxin (ccd killing protein)
MMMQMRTTLIIDQELLDRARQLTGIEEKTALVRAGLKALIAQEAASAWARLAAGSLSCEPFPGGDPRLGDDSG